MRYRNKKTGVVIYVSSEINAPNYELVEDITPSQEPEPVKEAPAPQKEPEKKAPTNTKRKKK